MMNLGNKLYNTPVWGIFFREKINSIETARGTITLQLESILMGNSKERVGGDGPRGSPPSATAVSGRSNP